MLSPRALVLLAAVIAVAVPAAAPASAAAPALTKKSRISSAGVGPLKIGMSLRRAERATGRDFVADDYSVNGCGTATMRPASYGVYVLTTGGRVVVISISRRGLATRAGIRVRDSVARLKQVYGSQLVAKSQLYSPGSLSYEIRYGNRKLIFATDNRRVLGITSGRKPEVNYVEGCS